MPNTSRTNRRSNLNQDLKPYLNLHGNWKSNRGDVHLLMKRLKKNKQKENKERFIFMVTAISLLLISGIIISF